MAWGVRAGTADPVLTASRCVDRVELGRGTPSSGHKGPHQAQQRVEEEPDSTSIVICRERWGGSRVEGLTAS